MELRFLWSLIGEHLTSTQVFLQVLVGSKRKKGEGNDSRSDIIDYQRVESEENAKTRVKNRVA